MWHNARLGVIRSLTNIASVLNDQQCVAIRLLQDFLLMNTMYRRMPKPKYLNIARLNIVKWLVT